MYFIEVNTIWNDEMYKKIRDNISIERQNKIDKLRYPIDKKLSLFAELLIRKGICSFSDVEYNKINFLYNEYGKPYIEGKNCYFSLSHTKNAIFVAISSYEVGVDIERIKKINYKIIERFFTIEEKMYIERSRNRDRAFYDIWTKKEAYIKYMGTGLHTSLNSFNILEKKYLIKSFQIRDYQVSICSEEDIQVLLIDILSEKELLQLYV